MAEPATKLPVETEAATSTAPAREGWGPLDTLRREVDRLFDDFGSPGWPFAPRRALAGRSELPWPAFEAWRMAPAVDLVEKDGEWELTAELPGLDETDIEISVANGALTLRGRKEQSKEEVRKEYHVSERRYGAFQRSFRLPEGVDADRIAATFGKGVLTLSLPKTAEAKMAKKIAVKPA
jgi:HSP20 family protein